MGRQGAMSESSTSLDDAQSTLAQPKTAHPDALSVGPVILVIDDDPQLGTVVEACLDFEGATVRTAHTMEAARTELRADIDHIVLDRRLPDGDGLDLLDEIAKLSPRARVIVFSAYDDGGGHVDLPRVPKSDIATLVQLLGLERPDHRPPATL